LKYAPCSPGKIRDPETKRCREKKSRGRKVGQVAAIDAVARALANKTRDAYSFNRYKDWVGVIKSLLKYGFSERNTEELVSSKVMRWAADDYEGKGKVPTSYFKKFILSDTYPIYLKNYFNDLYDKESESDTETESESDKE
jgi:hypothetical protein